MTISVNFRRSAIKSFGKEHSILAALLFHPPAEKAMFRAVISELIPKRFIPTQTGIKIRQIRQIYGSRTVPRPRTDTLLCICATAASRI